MGLHLPHAFCHLLLLSRAGLLQLLLLVGLRLPHRTALPARAYPSNCSAPRMSEALDDGDAVSDNEDEFGGHA